MDADEVSAAVPWVGTARISVGPLRAVEGTVRVDRGGVTFLVPGRPEERIDRSDATVAVDDLGGVTIAGRRGRRRRVTFGPPPLSRHEQVAASALIVGVGVAALALDLPTGTVPAVAALMLLWAARIRRANAAIGAASPDRAAVLDALGAVGVDPMAPRGAEAPDAAPTWPPAHAARPAQPVLRRLLKGDAAIVTVLLLSIGLIGIDLATTTPREAQEAAEQARADRAAVAAQQVRDVVPLPEDAVIVVAEAGPGYVEVPFEQVHDHAIAAGLTVERTSEISAAYFDDGEQVFSVVPRTRSGSTTIVLGG